MDPRCDWSARGDVITKITMVWPRVRRLCVRAGHEWAAARRASVTSRAASFIMQSKISLDNFSGISDQKLLIFEISK